MKNAESVSITTPTDREAVGTVTFVEKGGKTTLTISMLYASKAVRDAVLQSPMKEGVGASFDKLSEVLASAASAA